MTKQYHDEIDEFQEQLSSTSSRPDEHFRRTLKQKLLKQCRTEKANLFSQFRERLTSMKFPQISFQARLATASLTVIAVGAIGWYVVGNPFAPRSSINEVSVAKRDEILGQLAQYGSREALLGINKRSAQDAAATAEEAMLMPSPFPEGQSYTYHHATTTIVFGAASGSCPAIAMSAGRFEYYDFYSEDAWYSKSISYDADGNLYDYYLYRPGENYQYRGGEFAIKTLQTADILFKETSVDIVTAPQAEEVSEPSDSTTGDTGSTSAGSSEPGSSGEEQPVEPVDDVGPITAMFGKDATVEEVIEDGKVVQYIVTWEYTTYCTWDQENMPLRETAVTTIAGTGDEQTIVEKTWFSADSMQALKSESYLGSVADENLIQTTANTYDFSNAAFDEVQSAFEFEFDVPIETIDPAEYAFDPYSNSDDRARYIADAKSYLKDNKVEIVVPSATDLSINSFSIPSMTMVPDPTGELLQKREFYPAGEQGTKIYEDMVAAYEIPANQVVSLVQLAYSGQATDDQASWTSLDISIFASEITTQDLISNYLYLEGQQYEQTEATVTISGEQVAASKYVIEQEMPVPLAVDDAVTTEEQEAIAREQVKADNMYTIYYLFDRGGYRYLIHMDTSSGGEQYTSFTGYDPNDAAGMGAIELALGASFETAGDGGGSEPAVDKPL
jgi:hypothetical protein